MISSPHIFNSYFILAESNAGLNPCLKSKSQASLAPCLGLIEFQQKDPKQKIPQSLNNLKDESFD